MKLVSLVADSGQTYKDLLDFYRPSFRTEDTASLDVCLSTVATSSEPGDPLWCFVVGPPSSSKTENLRPLKNQELPTYFLSSLTNHALVSGLKDGKSLLSELNKRTLVIKDFTTVLEMSRDKRDEILSDLRDAYDGTYAKSFGTVGTLSFDSHFNFLAAVTNVIEKYYTVMSVLGQRFLLVRVSPPSEDFETDGIEDIRSKFASFVQEALLNCQKDPLPECPKDFIHEIKGYASEIAILRTHVWRDGYRKDVTALPEPEGPMRLTNQLLKLARGLAKVRGRGEVGKEEIRLARRVARDTIPSIRLHVLKEVIRGNNTTAGLSDSLGLSRPTVERYLEDLTLLEILDVDTSEKPHQYYSARDLTLLGGKVL